MTPKKLGDVIQDVTPTLTPSPQLTLDFDVAEVVPDFLADGFVVPYHMFRADHGGEARWYYCPEDDRNYASVTTIIGATSPTPYGLMNWIKMKGQFADIERDEAAAYGTFLHIQIGQLLRTRQYDFRDLPEIARVESAVAGLPMKAAEWHRKATNDILAFEAFRRRHQVEPLAIEVIVKHSSGYAGAVDLVCRMTIEVKGFFGETYKTGPRKGEPKESKQDMRVPAIVDFKSGRKGFFESHELQLHMYRQAYDECLDTADPNSPWPTSPLLFNWSPKDWRSAPDFNLKDQTESRHAPKIPHMIGQFFVDAPEPSPEVVARGLMTEDVDLADVYRFESIRDRLAQK